MNEKIRSVVISVFILFCFTCGGCKIAGYRTDLKRSVIEHPVEIERSEAIKRELIKRIDRGEERLGNLAERAELLSGDIGEIIELFMEYDRIVRGLLADLRLIPTGTGGGGEGQDLE